MLTWTVATYPVKGNAIFLQDGWRYQRHLVAKESVTALGAAGKEACRVDEEETMNMRYFTDNPEILKLSDKTMRA